MGKSILVIDDSVDLLLLQRVILELDGFTVLTAQSGVEALDVLKSAGRPNLILLDVMMDDMSGPEFLKAFAKADAEAFAAVPVVFLSGVENVSLDSAIGFIRKPFEPDRYLVDVHRFLNLGRQSGSRQP